MNERPSLLATAIAIVIAVFPYADERHIRLVAAVLGALRANEADT